MKDSGRKQTSNCEAVLLTVNMVIIDHVATTNGSQLDLMDFSTSNLAAYLQCTLAVADRVVSIFYLYIGLIL